MKLLSVLSLASMLVYFYFGISVIQQNRKALVNRIFWWLCMMYTAWCLFSVFKYSAETAADCRFWYRLSAPVSFACIGILMHFYLALCMRKPLHPGLIIFSYLPPLFFILNNLLFEEFVVSFSKGPYGWVETYRTGGLVSLLTAGIFGLFAVVELLLVVHFWRTSMLKREKRQAAILLIGSLATSSVSGGLQAMMSKGGVSFPISMNVVFLILIGGMWYSLKKFNFLGIQLSLASTSIVAKVHETLILVDRNRHPVEVNASYDQLRAAPDRETPVDEVSLLFLERETVDAVVSDLMDRSRPSAAFEAQFKGFGGELVPVFVQIDPMLDMMGDVEGLLFLIQDLRPIKYLEDVNRSKSAFLANMSHEIRTPMNGIIGMAQLLRRTKLTQNQEELVQILEESSSSLLRLLNDILDYSKLEANRIELVESEIDIRKICKNVASIFQYVITEKKLTFDIEVPEHIPDVLVGDAFRVQQVLTNLVGNAVKFTRFGGIRVVVEEVTGDKPERFLMKITVSDSGIGIPTDKLHLLFKRFSQVGDATAREFGGTGLGLAICRSLVALMGGEIGVDSQEGKGSRFFFTCQLGRPVG